jgi:hypothetical protein
MRCPLPTQQVVRGDYVIPERVRSLRQSRGDDETYTSRSEELFSSIIDANGPGPIATAQRSGVEVVIQDAAASTNFKRASLAQEFEVANVHFVPLADGSVLEYGQGNNPTGEQGGNQGGNQGGTPQSLFDADADAADNGVLDFGEFVQWQGGTLVDAESAYATDQQYARVRQLNKYAKLDLGLRRAQDNIRTLRGAARLSRRATLIAPLATVSAISVAQYVTRPDFDFPGLDYIKSRGASSGS